MNDINSSYLVSSKAKAFSDEMQNYPHTLYVAYQGFDSSYVQQKFDMEQVDILGDDVTLKVSFKPNFYSNEEEMSFKITNPSLADKLVQVDIGSKEKMLDAIDDISDSFKLQVEDFAKEFARGEEKIKQNTTTLNSLLQALPANEETGIKLNSLEREDGAYKIYFSLPNEEPILYDTLVSSKIDKMLAKDYTQDEFLDVVLDITEEIENTYDAKEILEVLDKDRGFDR